MSKWTDLISKPRSKFLVVKCSECGNEQIVFSAASTVVKCSVCDGSLAEPTGGKAIIHGEIITVFD